MSEYLAHDIHIFFMTLCQYLPRKYFFCITISWLNEEESPDKVSMPTADEQHTFTLYLNAQSLLNVSWKS